MVGREENKRKDQSQPFGEAFETKQNPKIVDMQDRVVVDG